MVNDFGNHYKLFQPDIDHGDAFRTGCAAIVAYIAIIFLIIVGLAVINGCSPKVIERNIVTHDTAYVQKWQRDSIYMHDSIYVTETHWGDTLRIVTERWHTLWREKIVHDTAYISHTDTLWQEKTEQVAKPLSGWQWAQIWAGRLLLLALAAATGVWILKRMLIKG